ncbi:hypothetical protein BD408DRAFT_55239 [Parasitella parasitica]|nr:hypothetical protein BD408DRAFT_55239 [Parasitella parasitica]
MLFPENYREFTIGYLSKFLNHDDTIPETQLQDYVQQTENAWKHRIEPKQEPVRDVENTASAKTDKGFRNKLRSIFIKEKEVKVIVDPERLFQGAYHVGTFQASPAYDETGDSKTVDKDIDKYDVNNASFHDRREIKAFINLKNSQAVMDIKFDRVKKSELGFIGTSTCGTTDYLNRWES